MVVNCAALPESLTQSELFGYEQGAFTHALKAHPGRLELAHRGTVLLAGIDELSMKQQSALLPFCRKAGLSALEARHRSSWTYGFWQPVLQTLASWFARASSGAMCSIVWAA